MTGDNPFLATARGKTPAEMEHWDIDLQVRRGEKNQSWDLQALSSLYSPQGWDFEGQVNVNSQHSIRQGRKKWRKKLTRVKILTRLIGSESMTMIQNRTLLPVKLTGL